MMRGILNDEYDATERPKPPYNETDSDYSLADTDDEEDSEL